MVKVPQAPPARLIIRPEHRREFQGPLWRVFRTRGAHPSAWNEMRHHGPVSGMRFDPHPPPPGWHADVSVLYAATDAITSIAEVFHPRRKRIDREKDGASLASWTPRRKLMLLDLAGDWPMANGASASIQMGPKTSTQAWARAINEDNGDLGSMLDGLYHLSAITGKPLVTLFHHAEINNAFPPRPAFHGSLAETAVNPFLVILRERLGFTVTPTIP